MYVIDPDDIGIKLLEPAIFEAVPAYAFAGDSITLKGKRFTKSDTVLIDGSPVQTNAFSDTALQFAVPSLKGGQHTIQVKQLDGTLSNKASLYIKPKIDSALQDNQITTRVSPGKKINLIGSGFSESTIVRINDVNLRNVLNPFTDIDLTELHRKHFLDGSKTLLEKVATTFPNAKVIVTGYYPPVSEHSDLISAVEILLVALGIVV